MEEHLVPRRCRGSLPTNSTVRVKNRDACSLLTGICACTQSGEREERDGLTHIASAPPSSQRASARAATEGTLPKPFLHKERSLWSKDGTSGNCISSSFQISFLSRYNFEGASALGNDNITDAQRCPQIKRQRKH